MPWLRSLPFLILLMLTGCFATMQTATAPSHLLLECPAPVMDVGTNGKMAATLNNYRWALRACNDDKAALRGADKE